MERYSVQNIKDIYGTLDNLENLCDKSNECWEEISKYKCGDYQKPYKPYFGDDYKEIMFTGINLNGGNDTTNAIDGLVLEAIDQYLIYGKYKIFKQQGYGGSPFYYYIPLLSFLYYSYSVLGVKFDNESALSKEQIISGYKYCGLTTLIKCSTISPDGRSKPSASMYTNCIDKFKKELDIIKPKALIIFTFFNYPALLADYFGAFSVILNKERYRVQRKIDLYVLELEHPLSTAITREKKYQTYSEAIYKLVEIQKPA